MYSLCVFPLLVVFALCESVYKTRQAPVSINNARKFRRDAARRIEPPVRLGEVTGKVGAFLNRNFGNNLRPSALEIKPLDFSNIMEKPLPSVDQSRTDQLHPGFGKISKDVFNKIAWRSPSDRLSLVSSNLEGLKVSPSHNNDIGDKFKYANIDFKNRIEDNIARFSEPSKNQSEGLFQQPDYLKVDSKIKDLIAQSLIASPTSSDIKSLKNNSLTDNEINDGLNNSPSNSINLNILLNRNISDILSLSKPELPSKTSLTIMGSKNGDKKPFKLLTQGDKLGDKFTQTENEIVARKHNEKILEKQNVIDITDLLKCKKLEPNPAGEEGAIKSARRLFDVIQSQNPLDLLNIPLLMDSFKIAPTGLNSKVSSAKLGSNPKGSGAHQNEAITIGSTTQKTVTLENSSTSANEKLILSPLNTKLLETTVSKPISLLTTRNHSCAANYLPWESLTSILTNNIPNVPLILIPLNKINLGSMMTIPDKNSFDFHSNFSGVNNSFEPLAEEMRKVFNYQDMFSKHFNNLNLKDLIDFSSTIQKSEDKVREPLNLLSVPFFKKPDKMEFQTRVEDFLKLSRLNASDFQQKLGLSGKKIFAPDDEAVRTLDFTGALNSSSLLQDAKKSKLHDRVSILPLLKVTANMALSKYSNNPIVQGKIPAVDDKMLNEIASKGNVSANQPEAASVPLNRAHVPVTYINIQNSSVYKNSDGSYIPEINSIISTEASLDKRLNVVDGQVVENSSASIGLSDLPFIPREEVHKKIESKRPFSAAEPLSSVMKTVANNFILQTIKEFQQSLNMNPKSLGHDTLSNNTNSSHETNETLERENVNSENNSLSTEGTSVGVTQSDAMTNETSNDNTFFGEKTQTDINSMNKDINQNTKEEEKSMLTSQVLGAETVLTLTTENENLLLNSSDNNSQDVTESVDTINLEQYHTNDMKSNSAQIKDLLSAALNDDTKDNIKYTNNSILRKFNKHPLPSMISSVTNSSLISIKKSQHASPQAKTTKVADRKGEFEHWDSETSILGNASYYLSNKTHQNVELYPFKALKNENFQIPAVLIEVLNRLEPVVTSQGRDSNYNMVLVPPCNNTEQSVRSPEEANSNLDTKLQNTDTNLSEDIPIKGTLTPITLTSENPINPKSDNIYQVVTLNYELDKNSIESNVTTAPCPKLDECILYNSNVAEKNQPTYDYRLAQNSFSPLHNNRPIIIVAIDPLKAWEGQHRSMGHMPLGIIIKSTSVIGRPELNETAMRGGTALIGEFGQNYAEFKCTTASPVESWKCKEVTLFPIYPMYPVYPLKPIIASNDTTTLTAKTK